MWDLTLDDILTTNELRLMHPALASTQTYYRNKIQTSGPCPAGVDWGDERAQTTRFEQLLKLIPTQAWSQRPSLNDLGCGYGALLEYLQAKGLQVDYLGIDLVPAMVEAAQARHDTSGCFTVGSTCPRRADYAVASGLFNVRGMVPEAQWQDFMLCVLDDLHAHSRLGFAFNGLTRYSDADHMRHDLYYADPLWLFDWCKRKYARNVALLHDYDLYDFTIIVRKDEAFAPRTGHEETT